MDPRTLALAVIFTGGALALTTGLLAAYRREVSLIVGAGAFLSAMFGFVLLSAQAATGPFLGMVTANLLILGFQILYACALRLRCGARPAWPTRFYLYLAVFAVGMGVGTYAQPNFVLRAATMSALIAVLTVEFHVGLRHARRSLPPILLRASAALAALYAAAHGLRVALVLAGGTAPTQVFSEHGANVFTLVATLVFSVLWAGFMLIVDGALLHGQLEEQNRKLSVVATTDELTGLFNRYLLEGRIVTEMERAQRYGAPLSLIMFDLDHFKRVNDTWGHQTGDAVLRQIAATIQALIREPDKLFRWGGEEFMILAPHTDLDGAAALAEKLRRAVARDSFPAAKRVSASFGVAQWRPPDSRDRWFRQVDQALYRAKRAGRDRVVRWEPGDELPIAELRLEWQTEWECGQPDMDRQHRGLHELARRLMEAALGNASEAERAALLDRFLADLGRHFADEEALLAAVDYPDLAAHAREHRQLLADAAGLARTGAGLGPSVLYDFLVAKVVLGHLIEADARYFPYVGQRKR